MRVGTWTMYQDYSVEQQASFSRVNRTFNKISSGQNIEYGYQDINIQTNALRLNDQLSSLEFNKAASWAGREYGLNTDTAMSGMVEALTSVKSNLVKASNQTNSPSSLAAIAQELRGLKNTLTTLSNSSLNGQYLFSGTDTQTQPIAEDGTYQGNSGKMKATINAGMSLAYNIDGKGLFLGQNKDYARDVTTNVPKLNKPLLYAQPPVTEYIKSSSNVSELTGNPGDGSQTYFYASGTNSNGTSFKQSFAIGVDSPMSDVLNKIKTMYSNDVDVSLNEHGEIEVKDLLNGSSKLDFKMVASSNSVAATRTIGGITANSTSMTVVDATGFQPGDVLNIEKVGQVTVSDVSLATNTVNFVGTPLTQGLPYNMSSTNVTKSLTPSSNTTTATAIAAAAPSPQTITVANAAGAIVGGTLALVDGAGASISGTISNITGSNITFTYSGTAPAGGIAASTVKFATPANLTQVSTLGANVAAGANSIAVGSTQGMTVGGNLTISGSNGYQTLKIAGIDSAAGTVTLEKPPGVLYSFSAGESVSTGQSIPVYSNTALVLDVAAGGGATTSPTTNIELTSTEGLTVGGAININGIGTFNISGIDSATNIITIDTLGQAGIAIGIGVSASNATNGVNITEFTKSGSGERILGDVSGYNDYLNHSIFNFNIEFLMKDNGKIAQENDRLNNILGGTPTGITLNNTSVPFVPPLPPASTITDYMASIQTALNAQFGSGTFSVDYVEGRMQILDETIPQDKLGTVSSQLVTVTLNAPDGTFSPLNGLMTDNVKFAKNGNMLLANASQITKDENLYVTPATKLVDAAGVSSSSTTSHPIGLEGHILDMPVTTISGVTKFATLNFQYDPTATVTEGLYRSIYNVSQDTTASAGAAIGATTITVPAGLNVYPGSTLSMGSNATATVSATATAAGITTLTFAPALGSAVALNDKITITNSYDVPNAGYPGSATTSTQPNNFTYDQLLNVISMGVSGQAPALGVTGSAVAAAGGTGSVSLSVGSTALSTANVGGDIMLYDNNNVPYYATITALNTATGAVSFSYNTNSWSTVGFNLGNKIQVGFNAAVNSAQRLTPTTLDETSKIQIEDTLRTPTLASFALYDSNLNGGYGTTEAFNTTALTVNSNNALTIDDPYIDFFSQLDEAIAAVEQGILRPNSNSLDPRNSGIQNCMAMVDHILDHVERKHTEIGAATDTFQESYDRIEILTVNVAQVRSNFTDTDTAAAAIELNQRMLSYQALMSLATKINSLSLVNYVK